MRTVLVAALLLGAACEEASHETVDRWRYTEKGPDKLVRTLGDEALDPDLRAHAAQALVEIDAPQRAMAALAEIPPEPREPIVEKLLVRLWGDAKVSGDMQIPSDRQVAAKDALFEVRALATPAQVARLDGYLIDWLSALYEERARLGRHHGEKIIHAIGARAAPKLIAAARLVVDRPEQGGKLVLVQDLLLRGIAGTGAPEAIGYLLDLAEKRNYPEPTLPVRAMRALGAAYLDTQTPAASAGLEPHVARLEKLADDERLDGEIANLAFELIAASGSARCLPPLLQLVGHRDVVRSWQAVRLALRCRGADAIVPVVEALPTDRDYERGILEKYLWQLVIPLGSGAADAARKLLGSPSWVARVSGVELIAKLGGKADAAAVKALAHDEAKLRGWWPKGDARRDPTLGDVAQNVAEALEKKQ